MCTHTTKFLSSKTYWPTPYIIIICVLCHMLYTICIERDHAHNFHKSQSDNTTYIYYFNIHSELLSHVFRKFLYFIRYYYYRSFEVFEPNDFRSLLICAQATYTIIFLFKHHGGIYRLARYGICTVKSIIYLPL